MFQPWKDTIPLLAGVKSSRMTRPGEDFEKREQRDRKSLLAHAVRLLTLLRLMHAYSA
ncbi:MAG TPA: hypothetical protein VK003_13575 [Oceanobacillus sp.]|nr:hypothetical protein [Oceanobacillus sp.]